MGFEESIVMKLCRRLNKLDLLSSADILKEGDMLFETINTIKLEVERNRPQKLYATNLKMLKNISVDFGIKPIEIPAEESFKVRLERLQDFKKAWDGRKLLASLITPYLITNILVDRENIISSVYEQIFEAEAGAFNMINVSICEKFLHFTKVYKKNIIFAK